jgi:uncharacterized membrane protein YsdA (DUF1294 family)/cold shock CspA family protein
MRQQGKLTDWNDEKGFGFITPSVGGSRVFVHISSFPRGRRRPMVNERVTYTVSRDGKNRIRAVDVTFQKKLRAAAGRPPGLALALALFAIFFALLAGLTQRGDVAPLILIFYFAMSALSFAMYGLDKSAAKRGGWRTAEATLHLFELAGGWPGALVAQRLFRHKTKKQPFQFLFWCAVLVNCAALGWVINGEAGAGFRLDFWHGLITR